MRLTFQMWHRILTSLSLTYKATNNADEIASTMQVFMINSIFSSKKHVVALFPVINLNTATLVKFVNQVLKMLHDVGFIVVTLISDNNRVNRNAFEALCGGKLKISIPNPYKENEQLFFLFDTVHILKCVRNNFLNQKIPAQTFVFPSENGEPIQASLKPLKEIYHEEKSKMVKLAPALSEKVLYPTNLERQNVQYAVRLFDEKNIAALQIKNAEGSAALVTFLSKMLKWWRIVNVKHPFKGTRLRLEDCQPIKNKSDHDPNLIFLKQFSEWLQNWENFNQLVNERVN